MDNDDRIRKSDCTICSNIYIFEYNLFGGYLFFFSRKIIWYIHHYNLLEVWQHCYSYLKRIPMYILLSHIGIWTATLGSRQA